MTLGEANLYHHQPIITIVLMQRNFWFSHSLIHSLKTKRTNPAILLTFWVLRQRNYSSSSFPSCRLCWVAFVCVTTWLHFHPISIDIIERFSVNKRRLKIEQDVLICFEISNMLNIICVFTEFFKKAIKLQYNLSKLTIFLSKFLWAKKWRRFFEVTKILLICFITLDLAASLSR